MCGQESESPTEADGVARDDQRGMANLVEDDAGLTGLGFVSDRSVHSQGAILRQRRISGSQERDRIICCGAARCISEIRSRGLSELGTSSTGSQAHLASFQNTSHWNYRRDRNVANYQAPNVHNCSLQVVRNASGGPLKYVMKYFNIKADQTNLADVENLGDSITRLENAVYNLQQREVSITKSVNPPASSWSITRTSSCSTSESSYRRSPFHTPCTSLNT